MFPAVLPTYNRADVAFVRGEGSYLFAEDGKRYLDFGSGVAVTAFGHAHPRLIKALTEQAGKVWHTSNLYRIPGQESLAGKLVVHARNRNECLLRLRRALDELVVDGIETTIPLFQKLVREPDIINGDYSIHWLEKYLASLGH